MLGVCWIRKLMAYLGLVWSPQFAARPSQHPCQHFCAATAQTHMISSMFHDQAAECDFVAYPSPFTLKSWTLVSLSMYGFRYPVFEIDIFCNTSTSRQKAAAGPDVPEDHESLPISDSSNPPVHGKWLFRYPQITA